MMMPRELWCTSGTTHHISGAIFYVGVIVVCGFIVVTLYTGAVAVSMTERLHEQKEKRNLATRSDRLDDLLFKSKAQLQGKDHRMDIAHECRDHHARLLFGEMSSWRKGYTLAQQRLYQLRTTPNTKSTPRQLNWKLWTIRHKNTFQIIMPLTIFTSKLMEPDHPNKPKGLEGDSLLKTPASIGYRVRLCHAELSLFCWEVTEHWLFHLLVFLPIALAAVFGFANLFYPEYDCTHQRLLLLDAMKWVFTFEFVVKLLSEANRPLSYFVDSRYNWNPLKWSFNGWNCFDFVVLVCTLWPNGNEHFAMIRALRLIKIVQICSKHIPTLRVVVEAVEDACNSIAYLLIVWVVIMYMFAVLAVHTFGKNDPASFGTLGEVSDALTQSRNSIKCMFLLLTPPFPSFAGNIHIVYREYLRWGRRHHVYTDLRL
jgi:hypothetical protein